MHHTYYTPEVLNRQRKSEQTKLVQKEPEQSYIIFLITVAAPSRNVELCVRERCQNRKKLKSKLI